MRIGIGESLRAAPRISGNQSPGDERLDAKEVAVTDSAEAKYIAGQQELDDMSAPVPAQGTRARSATYDPIPVLDRICAAVHPFARFISSEGCQALQLSERAFLRNRRAKREPIHTDLLGLAGSAAR
jgi:hypothetical protein